MTGRLDKLIVIDIEATCWESEPPPGQEAEIIEIGVCVLDIHSGDRLARRSILVHPEQSEISPFCTELTSLTPDAVARGVSFETACDILRRRYGSGNRAWASYGDYDRHLFERQCAARSVVYPFGHTHINVKNLVAVLHGLPTEVGLAESLRLMNLSFDGTPHRGVDDAWNTASLLTTLMIQQRQVALLHEVGPQH